MNARIREFQSGVARRAAAQAADPRWLHQKALAALSSWDGVRGALAAARPSPWGAVVLLMMGSFVRSVVEQFAQVGCRGRAPDSIVPVRTRWRAAPGAGACPGFARARLTVRPHNPARLLQGYVEGVILGNPKPLP